MGRPGYVREVTDTANVARGTTHGVRDGIGWDATRRPGVSVLGGRSDWSASGTLYGSGDDEPRRDSVRTSSSWQPEGPLTAADVERHVDIVLLGLMGVGKSTVGRLVARRLQRPFVDSDSIVELHEELSVVELERRRGIDALHAAERQALERVLGTRESVVFAAAASVVDWLEPDHVGDVFTVWLSAPVGVLAARVERDGPRPLLGDDPAATLAAMADDRRERARGLVDLWVDTGARRPRDVADEIVAAWRRYVDVVISTFGRQH